MKKLMMAVAIVCAAAGVQAATYNWSGAAEIVDWNTSPAETYATGSILFYINDVAQTPVTLTAGGPADFSFTLKTDDGLGHDVDVLIRAIATVNNFSDGAGTKEWTFTFNETYVGGKPSPDDALDAMTGDMNLKFDADGNGIDFSLTAAENNYTSVPEPTSGLLLLLGVAGLALKRKRA